MTRTALIVAFALLLPTVASARDWVTVENHSATHRVLTDVTANHCVRSLSGLDRQRLHPGEETRAAPEPDLLDTDCTWEIVGNRTGWMVTVHSAPYGEYVDKDLLGTLSGDGFGRVAWSPAPASNALVVVPVQNSRGSLQLTVIDAKRGKPVAARNP